MRVTNSMLVNNLMNNLNNNLARMDKLQGQLASGRKFGHISDDPIALIYAQAARSRLHSLSHYQGAVQSAQDWLRQVESGVMELQGRVADVYNEIINAATDVKGLGETSDKRAIAMLIEQLRDHYLDTLNATFGDKYMYAGYNTPGDSATAKITGPFTLDDNWNLYYNGHPLSNFLQISIGGVNVNPNDASGIFGGLKLDISGDTANIPANVKNAIDKINELLTDGIIVDPNAGTPTYSPPGLDTLNGLIKVKYDDIGAVRTNISVLESKIQQIDKEINDTPDVFYKYEPDNTPTLEKLKKEREQMVADLAAEQSKLGTMQNEMSDLRTQQDKVLQQVKKYINTDELQYDVMGRVSISVGGVPLLKAEDTSGMGTVFEVDLAMIEDPMNTGSFIPNTALVTDMVEMVKLMNTLKTDVLTFDVGPAVSMPVTINGVDLAIFQGSDGTTLNIFQVLHEAYKAASSGALNSAASAAELGGYIKELQDSQNHLLTKVAELGGRTRRLDLLTARYEQDNINYEQMKSNAEDADFAEVIMYQKMAEAVYQAALSTGARIIQPTLMDFLR